MNHVKAFNNLIAVKKVFDKLGIVFWLDGGTCLGAYRENSFLVSDFDLDVGMFGEDDKKFPQIIQGLKDEEFHYFHIKEHPCGEGKQISCVRHNISLDIFVYYRRNNKRWRLLFDFDILRTVRYIPCVLPQNVFCTLTTIDFMDYGETFNLPHIEYLRLQYGDWRKDKTKGEFHWQSDYKCMDMSFEIFPLPKGKRRWVLTDTIKGKATQDSFFEPLIKEGYKLFPLALDKDRNLIDGRKRLAAYRKLGVPMVEAYICTQHHMNK